MNKNFSLLNAVQFLDALNENLFKYVVIYFLIFYEGQEKTSTIMSITGAVFIAPFILFSSLGGYFADKWSKSRIVFVTRCIQIASFLIALFCVMGKGGDWMYVLLFMIAVLSAIFGPSKYGIVPELVSSKSLMRANGYLAAFTYFGIILGTAVASLLSTLTHGNFPQMASASVYLAIIGMICSWFIKYTKPANPQKELPLFIYKEVFDSFKDMREVPYLRTAVVALGYFIFIGAFVQLNIIPYSTDVLKMDPIIGGYLFLVSAIGVGIGSLAASRLSENLTSLPWSGLGMSIGCFLFAFFPHPFWLNVLWLVGLGIAGGLFLVPAQAFIMMYSQPKNKGRNFGTANFLSFVAALLAAAALYFFNSLLGISPKWSFAAIGSINIIAAIFLFFLTKKDYNR